MSHNLTSLHLLHRFFISQLKGHSVQILSKFGEKLLLGHTQSSLLFICKGNGSHHTLPSIIPVNVTLTHATWTPRGNIVNTLDEVVTVTELGKDLVSTRMSYPLYLSVSNNECIYIADHNLGIYQSIDNGITWDHVFKPNDA